MSNQMQPGDEEDSHLAGLTDGAGCTEVWEHLSHHRNADEQVDATAE